MFTKEQVQDLNKKLDPKRIHSRSQAGRSLSYLEGWDVIATANRIFGLGNWGYEVTRLECVGTEQFEKNGKTGFRVGYVATVRITVVVVQESAEPHFEDVGYGNDISYNSVIDAHELASKEAVTDAIKRSLKNYGDQFGLCLYDKEQKGVATDDEPPVVATPARVNELIDALKGMGKEKRWIQDVLAKQAEKDGGFLASEWVERQLKKAKEKGA